MKRHIHREDGDILDGEEQAVTIDGTPLADRLWKHYQLPETATVPVWMMDQEEDQGNASKIE